MWKASPTKEEPTVIQLLVQLPDAGTLTELIDDSPLREVASRPGCFLYVIEDGQVSTVPPLSLIHI